MEHKSSTEVPGNPREIAAYWTRQSCSPRAGKARQRGSRVQGRRKLFAWRFATRKGDQKSFCLLHGKVYLSSLEKAVKMFRLVRRYPKNVRYEFEPSLIFS